ncbi:MAG: DUF72 domain-containing protein [Pseudomonadota bacterium]
MAPLHLGLPAWALPGWKDRYFSDTPSRLASYARVFDTVEGNTTFYRTPDADTVGRWRDAVSGTGFRFCLKLPREVTHEYRPDLAALSRFVETVLPLAPHLGPLLVQFPADVGPRDLDRIDAVLTTIERRLGAAVEVRHPALFEQPERLLPLLERHGASRVSLDARPLHLGDTTHPEVQAALHKKPDLPLLEDTVGEQAFVRLVLHPDHASNAAWIEEWLARTATWLESGIETWMMIHCPNNLHCPEMARDFHERLSQRIALPVLPGWPTPQQMSLV